MKKIILIALSIVVLSSCGGFEEEWIDETEAPNLQQLDEAPDGLLPNEDGGWVRRPELDLKKPTDDLQPQQTESFKAKQEL